MIGRVQCEPRKVPARKRKPFPATTQRQPHALLTEIDDPRGRCLTLVGLLAAARTVGSVGGARLGGGGEEPSEQG
eukprot:6026047-Pleurochrysis_carterae.AAC.1